MADCREEIDTALVNNEAIPKEKFLQWIAVATDLPTLAKVYRISNEGYYRIQPDLGDKASCGLIQRFFLECIRHDVKDDEEIPSRWEAAQDLHAWFCHLHEMGDSSEFLKNAAQAITELFLASSKEIQDAIEMGFLEHALETEALRPYFENWASDDRLRDAWENALAWGKAHPDFTWGMLKELRKLNEESS